MMTADNKKYTVVLTLALWVALMAVGFWLAALKPLWNDELFSQISTIEGSSYGEIVTLKFEEGNSSPLFYLIQKAVCQVTGFHLPVQWAGDADIRDLRSQLILRIVPNVFMSLAVAGIFYYFSRFYSLAAGVYALLVAVTSFMVWAFWAEARHYSLWVLLTSLQALLFLRLSGERDVNPRLWRWLTVVHVLLSFTVTLGMVQIFLVSLLLWIGKVRDFRKFIFMAVIPIGICLFYYFHSPHYKFFFKEGPLDLINASIPKDRMLIFAVYALGWLLYYLQRRGVGPKIYPSGFTFSAGPLLVLTGLMVAASFGLLLVMEKFMAAVNQQGFQVANRYVINLTPVGIIATALFSIELLRSLKGRRWLQAGLCLVLGGLLLARAWRVYGLLLAVYPF